MAEKTMSGKELGEILHDLAGRLMDAMESWNDVVFIGIRSGGFLVARNVVSLIEKKTGNSVPLGALDIALYRDCLLYTSPSTRERTRSRMPSSA